ncbi:MAG TPA: hypothetical protein VLG44_08910 [Chlamydiales bacterium]|nr:hypothetical protein [Chlamydiales bacterium]
MAVELRTSRPLTSYFSSKTGKVYWDIFDEIIQKFLTVRDLTSFFITCLAIGKHKCTFTFKSAFIGSRCSAEKLKQLAIDCLLKQPGLSLQNRLLNSLSASERLFLKKGAVPLWPSEDWETIPPRELDTIRHENDLIDVEWTTYHTSPNVDDRDPIAEERTFLGIPAAQPQAPVEPREFEGLVPAEIAEGPLDFDHLGDPNDDLGAPRAPRDVYNIYRLISQVGSTIVNYYDPTGLITPAFGLFEGVRELRGNIDPMGFVRACAFAGVIAGINYFTPKLITLVLNTSFIFYDWTIMRRN